jgi:Sugar (and other) transporter.
MSWGPICWVLISEIFPNKIRGQATAVAVAFQMIPETKGKSLEEMENISKRKLN